MNGKNKLPDYMPVNMDIFQKKTVVDLREDN